MSVSRQEIDLIIRAQLKGQNSFTGVSKAIAGLSKDIDAQVAAAKRGEISVDELKASYLALENARKSLQDQAGLVAEFDRTSNSVAELSTKLDKARGAYAAYQKEIGGVGDKTTDKQVNQLERLSKAITTTEAARARQLAQQAALKKELDSIGIALTKEADAEMKLRDSAAQVGLAMSKTQTAIKGYAQDLRLARDAERKLQAGQALRKMADDAIAATKGYTTLGRAIKALPAAGNMRAAIQDVLEPTNRVRASLADVTLQVDAITKKFKAGKLAAGELADTVRTLRNIQGRLVSQSGMVEDYSRQAMRLRDTRAEYVKTRATVQELASAVRNAKDRDAELEAKLKTAQAAHTAVRSAMEGQVRSLRQLRDGLTQAGIKTNDLAGAQQRLTETAKKSVSVLERLKTVSVQSPGKGLDYGKFADTGRTTLSAAQRLKGEVLALGATYVGLFGIINSGGKVLDAFNQKQTIQRQLALGVGNDQKAIAEEYKYAEALAMRLGVAIDSVGTAYAKFLAGGSRSGMDKQKIRFIFESFTELGRVTNLTEENMSRVYKALEQMVSKNRIQREEVAGQLGDVLGGAYAIFKQALEPKYGNLDDAIKKGKVTAEDLLLVAEKVKGVAAVALPDAVNSLQADQERLNTEIFNFKTLIAESGFATAYQDLIKELSAFFKSEDGKKFAESIAQAFIALAEAAKFLLRNTELVKAAFMLFIGLGVVRFLTSSTVGLFKMGEAAALASRSITALGGNVGTAQKALNSLLLVFSRLNIILAAFSIGYVLYAQVPQVKSFVDYTVSGFNNIIDKIAQAYRDSGSLRALWVGMIETFNALAGGVNKALAAYGNKYREHAAVRLQQEMSAADKARIAEIDNTLKTGKKVRGREEVRNSKNLLFHLNPLTAEIAARTSRDITEADRVALRAEKRVILETQARKAAAANAAGERGLKNALDPFSGGDSAAKKALRDSLLGGVKVNTGTPMPPLGTTNPSGDKDDKAEKAAEKRRRIAQALADELRTLEDRVTKKSADTLAEREAAIENSYNILLRKIRAFYGTGSELEQRLEQAKTALILEEREKAAEDRTRIAEQVATDIENIEAAAGRKDKQSLDERLKAIELSYADSYRKIADMKAKFESDGVPASEADAAKAKLDASVAALKVAETQQFYLDEMARREKDLNALIGERSAKLETIETLKEAGLLTDLEAKERAAEIVVTLQEGISRITEESLKWAEANRLALDPEQAARFIAAMVKARESAKGIATEFIGARQLSEMVANGATTAFTDAATAIGDAAAGTTSWAEGLANVRTAFLRFAADFLREIAAMILKQTMLNAVMSAGGGSGGGGFMGILAAGLNGLMGGGGAAAGAVKSSAGSILGFGAQSFVVHSGGIVGASLPRRRTIDPSLFVGAPRMHQGGIPGIAADEYPTILQKNEEVLSADNPRNVLNGGGRPEAAPATPQQVNIVNALDANDVANAVFGTAGFSKAIVNAIRMERGAVKVLLG